MVSFDAQHGSGGRLTLVVRGAVDWDAVLTLEPRWEGLIDQADLTDVTIDLTGVSFIDSTGIGLFISVVERIRARGADVRILKPERHVFRVFEVVGMDEVLPFVEATGA